jgi:spore coat protein H
MGVEFDYVKGDLEFADRKFTNVAVRYKGNGTWMMSQGSIKRSLKVDLNEYVKGQKIAGVSKLNFHNAVTDGSWMNEVLSHAFYRDAGVPAPRTAYARVYVTVPGKYDNKYFGLYSLVENIDDNFTDERFGTSKGSLFKPVTHSLFADLGDDWSNYQQTYDPKDSPPAVHTKRVIDFAKLVSKASEEEFAAKLPEFLDLENFSRFIAGTVWLSTLDSILAVGQNYYMYLEPKTLKFQFFPWDLDHSFGQFVLMGDQAQRNELSIHKPWRGENRFLERVFKVDGFKKLYLARLKEINETIGRPERITRQVEVVAAAIRPAVKDESEEKLARFDKAAVGESFEPARMGPGGPPGMNMGVQPIRKFVAERNKSVAAQLAGTSPGADMDTPPPGMPRNFGPGTFMGPALTAKFDADKDGNLSREELTSGFSKWFAAWDKEESGVLDEEQIRAALNEEFAPPGVFRPGGGGGPPPERPPE